MSFEEFSSTHGAPAKVSPDDKSKDPRAADKSATEADKSPAEVARAAKS